MQQSRGNRATALDPGTVQRAADATHPGLTATRNSLRCPRDGCRGTLRLDRTPRGERPTWTCYLCARSWLAVS